MTGRLPTTAQPDPSCSDYFPCGGLSLGTGCTGSEMGHLFNVDGVSMGSPGLFLNVRNDYYWSGTELALGSRNGIVTLTIIS